MKIYFEKLCPTPTDAAAGDRGEAEERHGIERIAHLAARAIVFHAWPLTRRSPVQLPLQHIYCAVHLI